MFIFKYIEFFEKNEKENNHRFLGAPGVSSFLSCV